VKKGERDSSNCSVMNSARSVVRPSAKETKPTLQKESSFALVLKNNPPTLEKDSSADSSDRSVQFRPDTNKYKTQIVKKIQFSEVKKFESHNNIVSFMNNGELSSGLSLINDRPKSRKVKFRSTKKVVPNM
jgi:hypothetical protein